MPIRGFVLLGWSEEPAIERLTPSAGFAALVAHRRVALLGADYDNLLGLAGLPVLAFRRPQSWGRLAEGRERLVEMVAGL